MTAGEGAALFTVIPTEGFPISLSSRPRERSDRVEGSPQPISTVFHPIDRQVIPLRVLRSEETLVFLSTRHG